MAKIVLCRPADHFRMGSAGCEAGVLA